MTFSDPLRPQYVAARPLLKSGAVRFVLLRSKLQSWYQATQTSTVVWTSLRKGPLTPRWSEVCQM